jgi:hypothetical protein
VAVRKRKREAMEAAHRQRRRQQISGLHVELKALCATVQGVSLLTALGIRHP